MSQQFKFNILTGTGNEPQTKYDNITTKEPYTFYLLETGIGYLGEKKLFDATTEDISVGKFFRKVEPYTITQADIDSANIIKPEGTVANTTGLLFTADNNETDDGDESKYFVPINITTTETIDNANPGNDIPTEAAIVAFVNKMIEDKVSFEIDGVPGVSETQTQACFPEIYSTNETRIGTWRKVTESGEVEDKPLYRKVISCISPSEINTDTTVATIEPNLVVKNIIGSVFLAGATTYTGLFSHHSSSEGNAECCVYYLKTSGNIGVYITSNLFASANMEIVIEYTKE